MADEPRRESMPRGRALGPRRVGRADADADAAPPGAGGAPVAPVDTPAMLAAWAASVARGEVPRRVRLIRAIQAALSYVLAILLTLISLAILWMYPAPTARPPAPPAEVLEDPGIPEVLLDRRIRVRTVPRAASPVPADVLISLPTDQPRAFGSWVLHCPPSAWSPPVTSGPIAMGQAVVRIPKVPPVACNVNFASGVVEIRVTAGSVKKCVWSGQLICR